MQRWCPIGFVAGLAAAGALAQPKPAAPSKPAPTGAAALAAQPAVAQPGGQPGAGLPPGVIEPSPPPVLPSIETDDPELITLAAFTEPVQLSTLIELVGQTLKVNITSTGDVPGSVVFNAPVPVKRRDLIGLLNSLLEQQGWAITENRFGWFTVQQINQIGPGLGAEHSSTRVFSTPNIRPSVLKPAIDALLAPTGQPGVVARQFAYIDDLGVIIATDTPARLTALGDIVQRVVEENARTTFIRLELSNISASVARERALQLVGQASPVVGGGVRQPNQPDANAGARVGGGLNNLGDRLWADPQGNALILAGVEAEAEQIRRILAVIDRPNSLVPKAYDVGSSAAQIANIAQLRGLGEVLTIGEAAGLDGGANFGNAAQNPRTGTIGAGMGHEQTASGGPVMLADEKRGRIIYYGTHAQQDQLAALIAELDTQADRIITQVYKLRNSDAEEIAEIINGLIQNASLVGGGGLLPDANQGGNFRRSNFNAANARRANQPNPPGMPARAAAPGAGGEEGFSVDAENAFVIAVKANNQLLVKAPAAQQPEFSRLIEKLDLRRPQVYIEATIVAVTADDRLRVAFEQQLINANGTGGVLNSNFGLGSFATGTALTGAKSVATGLPGVTAAIIRSDQVPIIMTALANETDSRVVSNPQLLVDDNEEAEVVSLDQQPTSSVSRGTSGQQDIVTAGDYAEAGTTLNVTPQISGAGYLRLKYNIELSSFTGAGSTSGGTTLPPPRQQNTIRSESITVPSDSTVVVGGLVVDTKSKTVAKVPLLGDIPLVGLLFQDRSTGNRKTVIYVFLTPKILQEPTFADLRLLTTGPQKRAGLAPNRPALAPTTIEIVEPATPPAPPPALPVSED